MIRDEREQLPLDKEYVTMHSETENTHSPYPPYPDSKERDHRSNRGKEDKFPVRTNRLGIEADSPSKNAPSLSPNTDRTTSGASRTSTAPLVLRASGTEATTPQITPCGSPSCRVCVAMGLLPRPPRPRRAPRGVVSPLPGSHHPLNTPSALARANRVWQAMVDYQLEHGHEPPRLADIASQCGFANAGLMSRYMQRLATQGRVRKVPVKGRGRYGYRWQAVTQ